MLLSNGEKRSVAEGTAEDFDQKEGDVIILYSPNFGTAF